MVATPGPCALQVDLAALFSVTALMGTNGNAQEDAGEPAAQYLSHSIDITGAGQSVTGVDFEIHNLPSGEVDGEISGAVTAVDAANYSLTVNNGGMPITLFVYVDTTYGGDASSLADAHFGWTATAQYYTSADLAVELDFDSGG